MNKLKEACIISHEHWLKEIEQTIATLDIDIPEIKIPEKTKEKIVSIKDSQAKSKKNKSIKRKVIKILVIAAIIASLVMAVVAYAPFKEFVIETFLDYNLLKTDITETNHPKKIIINNLPEGFVLVEENNGELAIVQKYEYGQKTFTILKNTPTDHLISNTYSEEIIFYNDGIKYTLFNLTDDCIEVVWLTDEFLYVLLGQNMTNEELTELSKNIK